MNGLLGGARGWGLGARRAISPLAILGEGQGVRAFRHFLSIGVIDAAVSEAAFDGIEAIGELALDPFEVGQARAVCELIEHPSGNQFRDVLDLRCIVTKRAHRDLSGSGTGCFGSLSQGV
jgi:hypothetical protein